MPGRGGRGGGGGVLHDNDDTYMTPADSTYSRARPKNYWLYTFQDKIVQLSTGKDLYTVTDSILDVTKWCLKILQNEGGKWRQF